MKFKKIVLVGMMGSGKSSIARIVAKKLNFKLCECDEIFENKHNILIKDYFKKFGEKKFRYEENIILADVLKNDNIVVSTGGGVILEENNRKLIFSNDDIAAFFIDTPIDVIYERIKNDTSRPLLKVDNPLYEIEKILSNRLKYYKLAQFCVKNIDNTPDYAADEIILKVK